MYKTILFPIDFTMESLNVAKKIIEDYPGEKLNLVLVHGVHASDSITDLLFFSKSALIQKLSSQEFNEACSLLRDLYRKQINSLHIELFSGFTQAAFNSFVSALKIDKIYCPASLKNASGNKVSADISRFLLKSNAAEKIVLPDPAAVYPENTEIVPQISIVK